MPKIAKKKKKKDFKPVTADVYKTIEIKHFVSYAM